MNQEIKTNHEWTRMDTNRPEDRWSCLNVVPLKAASPIPPEKGSRNSTTSLRGFRPPGARASRPHQAWHSLGHLPHLDQPGTAPGNRYFFMNMDAQDAQDKQDEGLLRGELTPAMIRCGRPGMPKRDYPGSAGVPPAPSLAQPRPSPPTWINRQRRHGSPSAWPNCGYCRRSGCLQSRAEAQRQPMGQHAGGTPALPGKNREHGRHLSSMH